jgi:putative flavoprotein involved in K+ transport
VLDVANVIWCTGFEKDFGWSSCPASTRPAGSTEERGAVVGQPGLYVLGQEFQYMFNSHTVGGVGKDAAYVVAAARPGAGRSAATAESSDPRPGCAP